MDFDEFARFFTKVDRFWIFVKQLYKQDLAEAQTKSAAKELPASADVVEEQSTKDDEDQARLKDLESFVDQLSVSLEKLKLKI